MKADLRATRLFDLMEELVNEGEVDLGIAAGEIGVKSARKDRYPEANYKLHGRLGELLLPRDNREAWRHLLSAAFGLPDDGMINLNLARVYEANGKTKTRVQSIHSGVGQRREQRVGDGIVGSNGQGFTT